MRHNSETRRYGFTLVEMMTVIMIIALLAGISIVAYRSTLMTFRGVTAKNQMDGIVTALEQYKVQYGEYPPDNTDADAVKRHVLKRWPEMLKARMADKVTTAIRNDYSDTAQALFFWLCGPNGLGFPVAVDPDDWFVPDPAHPGEYLDEISTDDSVVRDTPLITLVYDEVNDDNTNSGNATTSGYVFVYRDMPVYYFRAEKNGYDYANKYSDAGTYGFVAPYMKDGKWVNPTSYQLIHPGEDRNFSTLPDASADRDLTDPATCTPADLDNIVNFSEGSTLGSEQ